MTLHLKALKLPATLYHGLYLWLYFADVETSDRELLLNHTGFMRFISDNLAVTRHCTQPLLIFNEGSGPSAAAFWAFLLALLCSDLPGVSKNDFRHRKSRLSFLCLPRINTWYRVNFLDNSKLLPSHLLILKVWGLALLAELFTGIWRIPAGGKKLPAGGLQGHSHRGEENLATKSYAL